MFNKIAVVLRGCVRTWPHISQVVFDNFIKISKSIDYYFVTWDIPGLKEAEVIDSFKNQNLIKFLKVSTDRYYKNNTQGPSWLSNQMYDHLLPEDYDIIFDSRPDVLPVFFNDNQKQLSCKDNSVCVVWEGIVTDGNNIKDMGISDCFQYMSKDVYKLFCERYKINHKINNHVDLRNFYLEHNINIIPSGGILFHIDIVRPTQVGQIHLHASSIYEVWQKKELLISLWNAWDRLSEQNKIIMLNQKNILLEDYYLK